MPSRTTGVGKDMWMNKNLELRTLHHTSLSGVYAVRLIQFNIGPDC